MTRETLNVCRKCGRKFASSEKAKWHFWNEHRSTLYRRMAAAAVAFALVVLAVLAALGGLP